MNAEGPKPSKREFLAQMGKGALIASIPVSLGALFETGRAYTRKRDQYLQELGTKTLDDKLIERGQQLLEELYGVRVQFGIPVIEEFTGVPGEFYRGDALAAAEARRAIEAVFQTLSRYPYDFFRRNTLPQIVLAKDIVHIKHEGSEVMEEAFQGLAIGARNRVMVKYFESKELVEVILHHELYHILDFRDEDYGPDDLEWRRVQEACACGDYQPRPREEYTQEVEGPFLNGYSSTEPREDRATFAGRMLTPLQHLWLLRQMKEATSPEVQDAYAEKYRRIKADYFEWSKGVMDERYWNRIIAQGKKEQRLRAKDLRKKKITI